MVSIPFILNWVPNCELFTAGPSTGLFRAFGDKMHARPAEPSKASCRIASPNGGPGIHTSLGDDSQESSLKSPIGQSRGVH